MSELLALTAAQAVERVRSREISPGELWDAYRVAHEDLTQSKLRAWAEKHFLGFLRLDAKPDDSSAFRVYAHSAT